MDTDTVNVYDRLIGQLDSLVPFIALAQNEVFELMKCEYETWVTSDQRETLPTQFSIFSTQVCHAAFLLGYSYFEAFLSDIVREALQAHPAMLPRNKELKYGDILDHSDSDDIIDLMIEREVRSVTPESFDDIAKYFLRRLNIQWPNSSRLDEARALRNCIVHTLAIANQRLDVVSNGKWRVGEIIELGPSDVHGYGVDARQFAQELWPSVERQLIKRE